MVTVIALQTHISMKTTGNAIHVCKTVNHVALTMLQIALNVNKDMSFQTEVAL